jgi:hypothetical protein
MGLHHASKRWRELRSKQGHFLSTPFVVRVMDREAVAGGGLLAWLLWRDAGSEHEQGQTRRYPEQNNGPCDTAYKPKANDSDRPRSREAH